MFYGNQGGMTPADYAAVSRNNGGMFGGDGEGWIFILFLFWAMMGNNGWGGNGIGNEVQSGFDQAAVMNGIQGIQQTLMAYQISNNDNVNSLAMSLQNCCCQNQLATANLGAQIAADGCATRQAFNDGLRDVMVQNTANTQSIVNAVNNGNNAILDKICALELDAKNDKIADLQRQLSYQQAVADNLAQTNTLLAAINGTNTQCYCNGCA